MAVNFAFIDGRVSEESYKDQHELAYNQRKKQEEQARQKPGRQGE